MAASPANPCVGVFPLPGTVLFPCAVLPLHIFEERYKAMTADAIAGSRQIAMALYRPGWQKDYYGRAPIEPVVCLGTILSWERLDDGKYNFLLRGDQRSRIVRESCGKPYRTAELEPLAVSRPLELDMQHARCKLKRLFGCGPMGASRVGRHFTELLASDVPTVDLADLISFSLLEDVALKQSLLAETDCARRVARLIEALGMIIPMLAAKMHAPSSISLN